MAMLSTRGLTKRYPAVTALDDLSLELEPGIIGLVGANGAGKSTLIKILVGLVPATSGSAELLGLDTERQGPEIRRLVGYMPEHDCLPLEVTATEFVAHMARMNGLPRAAARERTAEILRHVGLFEERYREIRGYSTGMKQRVKLAQALVHDPKVLLLDEPTNGLDPAGRDEMLELIVRTGREFGISIIMATHLLGEIERVCEYLVLIDGGRLRQSGPIGGFTQRTGTYAVEVEGDGTALAAALRGQSLESIEDGRLVLVRISDEHTGDAIRDAVVDLGLGLVRLERRRQTLEDLFREREGVVDAAVA